MRVWVQHYLGRSSTKQGRGPRLHDVWPLPTGANAIQQAPATSAEGSGIPNRDDGHLTPHATSTTVHYRYFTPNSPTDAEGPQVISKDTLTNLTSAIESITKYRDTDLVERDEWGSITFDSVKPHITYAINTTLLLADMPLKSLTDHAAHELQSRMPAVADLFDRIDSFGIEQGDAAAIRDQIAHQVKTDVDQMHALYSRWIPYLAYQRGDITSNISKIEDAILAANERLEDAKTHQETKKEEVNRIVAATRDAAASAGVATFTHAFDKEAKKLADESRKWFWGTIGCSALAVGAIVLLYLWPTLPAEATTWQIVRNAFMKVSAIAVLFNGSVWCARMYRARSHQTSVNRHRALSLQTFQAFVEATDDSRTRDAVLLAATKSIFANVSTGLVGERPNVEDPSIQFLEIGKNSME